MKRNLFLAAWCIATMMLATLAFAEAGLVSQDPSHYRVPPHQVDKARLPPLSSSMILNGHVINHRTEWQAGGVAIGGESRNTSIIPDLLYTIDSQVLQSISRNNVFRSDQNSEYLQFRSAQNDHRVALSVTEPKTMLGMLMQTTLTGECEVLGRKATISDAQCSYTPALVVNRNALDPDFFLPTVISQEGSLGQEISPESMLLLAQPGFQNVGANGEIIGLDLYLPNIGLLPGNGQTTTTGVEREEEYKDTPQAGYSRVRQVLQSNANKALFARTIHGLPYLQDNDDAALGPALGLLGLWLPDFAPELPGTADVHDTKINMNLMRAANNSWLPGNSWTIYQAGMGYSRHPLVGEPPPDVWFNNIWIGLSPVTDRKSSIQNSLVPTASQLVISSAGAEGGSIKPLHLVIEGEDGLNIVDTQLLPSSIDDNYLQLYLSMTSQDVNLVSINNLRERTNWYSHLSYTGNLTSNDYLWRYYAGTIISPNTKNYIGSDFIRHVADWSFGAGAVYYTDQDVDYFSQINASVTHKFDLGYNWRTRTYTDWRYAYDRKPTVSALVDPPENYSRVGINLDYNAKVSLDVYHYFDVLDDSITETPGADFLYHIRDGWSFKSWFHPGTQVKSYGAGMEYNFHTPGQTIKVSANWYHQTQEYGEDPFYNGLETDQDIFMIRLEMGR